MLLRRTAWVLSPGILLLLFIEGFNATVLDLSNMLAVATNRNPLDFLNYGHWCGLGGSGSTVDSIDRCCKMHDLCYEKISDAFCTEEKPHLAKYHWKYAIGKVHCSKSDHPCGFATCRCDGKFTGCIDVYKDTYNPSLKKIRSPLYNAFNRVVQQLSKTRRMSDPFISIKLL